MSASIPSQPRPGGFHVPQVQRILPGPAGKLQQLAAAGALDQATPEALGLKDIGTCSTSLNPCLQDPCFQSTAWNSSKVYVAQQAAHGPTGQLHTVQMAKELSLGKVPQMLVLLRSFQPSGNGSAFSRVKDPTGSVGAALHCSTLKQQPQLGPGCVLLLQNVSVFTPARGTSYLAITANNIIKVWPAESAQDSIRNALHRPQQQQQWHQQQHQQPSVASQQGSQQIPTATPSGNASCLPQQQPYHGQRPSMIHRQQQDSVNTQQQEQQQRPRTTQLPLPSPHLPALINRSAGIGGAQGQQQQQQSHSQWQQQQHTQPGDCSPAVGIGRGLLLQQNDAAAGCSSRGMAGLAASHQQQTAGGSHALDAAAKGSMPPPAARMQPSSFHGHLQKPQETNQQQQQTQPTSGALPKKQLQQQATWPGGSVPGSGGSCGSLSGGHAKSGWHQQQQHGSQHSASVSQQMGGPQMPPALAGGSTGPSGGRVNQQQQWQQQASGASLQPPGSQSIPPALLGRTPGSVAQHQQQQRQPLPIPGRVPRDDGNANHLDGVDNVVAAIFGSQLGGAPAARGAPPTPAATPVAAAIFGSQLARTMQAPIAQTAAVVAAQRNTGWPPQQQQLRNDAGRHPPGAGMTTSGTPSVSGQVHSQKRFKPSDGTAGAAVRGAVLPNPNSGSQLGGWPTGQQQQKYQTHVSGGGQGDGGLFEGLFGFKPPMQQQVQRNAPVGSGTTQNAVKVPVGARPFMSSLGRPPVQQTNLLDDLIGDELDDFDM